MLFSVAVLQWMPSTSAHVVSGTETLIHIAKPGVEITFYASPAAWQRLTGGGEGKLKDKYAVFSEGWTVRADGRSCRAEVPDAEASMDGSHIRMRIRFLCASVTDSVSILPRLPFGKVASDRHIVRLVIADRMTATQFQPSDTQLTIPIGALLGRWKVPLAESFFTGSAE